MYNTFYFQVIKQHVLKQAIDVLKDWLTSR